MWLRRVVGYRSAAGLAVLMVSPNVRRKLGRVALPAIGHVEPDLLTSPSPPPDSRPCARGPERRNSTSAVCLLLGHLPRRRQSIPAALSGLKKGASPGWLPCIICGGKNFTSALEISEYIRPSRRSVVHYRGGFTIECVSSICRGG